MTHQTKRTRCTALPVVALAVIAAGCGGSEAEPDDAAITQEPAPETATAADVPEGSTLQSGVFANAEFTAELVTADGTGRIFIVVDCDPMTGGNLVTINPVGFPENTVIDARLSPSFGGVVTAQVGPDGSGVGARQGTLDEAEYTLSIAIAADTLRTTFEGCTEEGT